MVVLAVLLALLPMAARASAATVVPVGRAVGIKLFSDGVVVVGTSEVETGSGKINPAFNDVLLGKGNRAFYHFHQPLNARGQWKLQVREALTSTASRPQR